MLANLSCSRRWFPRDDGVFETPQARSQLVLKRHVVEAQPLYSNLVRGSN